MYAEYWGLKHNPFSSRVDVDAYYPAGEHQSTLLKLQYLITHTPGLGLLVGETGVGKSYLVRVLASQAEEFARPLVHLPFSLLSKNDLLRWLAVELGGSVSSQGTDIALRVLVSRLKAESEAKRRPLIVIDEAHQIDDPGVLEALRMLLNLRDTEPAIEFSLLLVGGRELVSRIHRIANIASRISVRAMLEPMSEDECREYVRHRTAVAGGQSELFQSDAWLPLYEITGGIPRHINRICDLSLLVGYADKQEAIGAATIEAAGRELTLAAAA